MDYFVRVLSLILIRMFSPLSRLGKTSLFASPHSTTHHMPDGLLPRSSGSRKQLLRFQLAGAVNASVVALLALSFFSVSASAAQESPRGVVFEGRAYDAAENPILDTNTTFVFQIYNPAKSCLLYQETQTGVNLNTTQGFFALEIGSATGNAKRSGFDPGLTMSQVYQNLTLVVGKDAGNVNCNYTPTAGDQRVLVVTMTPAVGAADTFPDIAMNSVPQALVAETLQGILPAGLIQVSGNVTQ